MDIKLEQTEQGVKLAVRVEPKASRNGVVGAVGERLKVAVTAAPEKGKANDAVVKTLAKALAVRASAVEIVSGETSRDKGVLLRGCRVEEIRKRVAALV